MEIFDFQELGSRGKVENDWDFRKIFKSLSNIDNELGGGETQRRFIFAPSGYGKSCFCEYAIYKWSKDDMWNEYDIVVLIKANRINRMTESESLITLLERSFIYDNIQEPNLTLEFLKGLASQNKLLVIVDGIDEIVNFPENISEDIIIKVEKDLVSSRENPCLAGHQIIVALLLGLVLPGSHLILTTRRYNMESLWEFCMKRQLSAIAIKLLPFEEDDVFQYIHEINHVEDQDLCRNEKCQRTIQLLKSNYNLLKLCSNPSCCMIVGVNSDSLSAERKENISATSLISRFIWNILMEHAKLNSTIKASLKGLSPFYKETLRKISQIAFIMFCGGERIMEGIFKEKTDICSECKEPDCDIFYFQNITFPCANKLKAVGILNLERDSFQKVTCSFDQEIGLLRDYFAAAHIVCEDKRINDIVEAIKNAKKFGKENKFSQFVYLNIHFYDILPITACMLFGSDSFTKSFLEALDNKTVKTNLTRNHFYKDITDMTSSKRAVVEENEGVFSTIKDYKQFYGSKVSTNLSRCAFESQEKCFDSCKSSGRYHILEIFHFILQALEAKNIRKLCKVIPNIICLRV